MSKISLKENGILFEIRDELVFVEPYGENCARVRATRNSRLSDERWTLLPPEKDLASISLENPDKAVLQNGKLTVSVEGLRKGCRITFIRNGEEVLSTREEHDLAVRYTHLEGDNYRTRVFFDARDEHIYGLGQEQQDFFDRKGCTYDLMHWNTKSTLPVIYSPLGYGFLWNNPAPPAGSSLGSITPCEPLTAAIRPIILYLWAILLPRC